MHFFYSEIGNISMLLLLMYRKSYCTTPSVGCSGGVNKMLRFYVQVFYVMSRVLSGKLSCTLTGLVFISPA